MMFPLRNFLFVPALALMTLLCSFRGSETPALTLSVDFNQRSGKMLVGLSEQGIRGSIEIRDIRNRVVLREPVGDMQVIDLDQLKPGLYFVTFSGGSIELTKKLLIEHP